MFFYMCHIVSTYHFLYKKTLFNNKIKTSKPQLQYLYSTCTCMDRIKKCFFLHTCNMHTCTTHTYTPPSPLSARSFSPRTARGHETP